MNAQSFTRTGKSRTGGYRFKMRVDKHNRNLRRNIFTQGSLYMEHAARDVVEPGTITTLKIHFDRFIGRKDLGIWGKCR